MLWRLLMNFLRSLCVYVCVVGFAPLSYGFWSDDGSKDPILKEVPVSKEQVLFSFAPVVKKVAPAVVNIYAARVVRSSKFSPFFSDPIFKHFFGEAFPNNSPHARIQSSLGSGVLVDKKGIVITNYHVIKHAEEIKVVLTDGKEYEANLVVKDKRADLAALQLKTDRDDLPYLELQDADQLEVGDIVLAVGNPFGVGQTVTTGIVSALARNQLGVSDFRSLIQTDAAINPGNSGGPLVTLDGRIVGINTAILSSGGGSIGIGFAIPSNLVAPVISGIAQGGEVKKPWVGILVQDITHDIAESMQLKSMKGALIQKVFPGSSAEKAGLKQGDILLTIDERSVMGESGFRFRVATKTIGMTVVLEIMRDGKVMEKKITLQSPPKIEGNKQIRLSGRNPLSGALITAMSPAVASEIGFNYDGEGVVILHVRNGTPVSYAGFLAGDILLSINGKTLKRVDDVIQNLGRSKGGWKVTFKRGGKIRTVSVNQW